MPSRRVALFKKLKTRRRRLSLAPACNKAQNINHPGERYTYSQVALPLQYECKKYYAHRPRTRRRGEWRRRAAARQAKQGSLSLSSQHWKKKAKQASSFQYNTPSQISSQIRFWFSAIRFSSSCLPKKMRSKAGEGRTSI